MARDDDRVFQEVLFKWKPKHINQDMLDRMPPEMRELLFLPPGAPPQEFQPVSMTAEEFKIFASLVGEVGVSELFNIVEFEDDMEAEVFFSLYAEFELDGYSPE